MKYISKIILLVFFLTLLLFTGCKANTIKPEIVSGNLENQEDFNQSSNNSQSSSTGSIYEPGTVYPQKWATGTGTAIDPWAGDCINDAYAAAAAAGDTIYLRAGYYTLASTLTIQGKTVNLIGEGRGETFIVTSMNHSAAMIVYDDYTTLKGFTLDAASQVEEKNRYAIKLLNGDYMTVEDIEVKNAGYAGIEYADINYATFRNLYLHDNSWLGLHAAHVVAERGKHNTFQYLYIWNHTHHGFDDGNDVGVWTSDCDNTYDNIHTWNNGLGGLIFWYLNGGNITNCSSYDSDGYGIKIGHSENVNVSNCSAWNCNDYGLQITYTNNLNISNSSFNFNNGTGIKIIDSSNIALTNVISKNNDVGDHGNLGAVLVESSTGVRFTSCQFYDDRETPLQDWGILTEGTASIEIINCKLLPNGTGAIYADTETVITEKILAKF